MKVKLLIVLMSHLSDIPFKRDTEDINTHCEFLKFLLLKFPNTNTEIDPDEQYAIYLKSKQSISKKCETCSGTGALPGTSEDCPDCMGSGLHIPDEFIL